MKRILLAGYGNVAHAFVQIMKEQEPSGSYTFTTCDLKDGQEILSYLPEHHNEFDLVLNTSQAETCDVTQMCIDYGLDYIDMGVDEGMGDGTTAVDFLFALDPLLKCPTRSRIMCGFGINPGILEHVYQKYKPQGPHYAFELEHDNAVSDEYEVFGTWSPYMYAEESCRAELVVINKDKINYITQQLKDDGGALHSDENLLGSAYLFQAPRGMQQCFLDHGTEMTVEEFLKIPVPHCLKGDDHVGMLFWDTRDRMYWVKNVMANQTTWKRYGTNAVCWQTATGAWIAYRLLDAVSSEHPHTMTELSQLMPEKIDALLNQIGLTFEVEEQPFSVEEFKKNIMRYF